ncbi:estradiol 17-beta-dehydrogenase 2 [Trichonephila inaurata madagascariensis]|uniref:Estradiol 17-beta-dehydrogenase 2 n=1 Tax=Trichonephila inaurata madagascariensis TaxID=2747483 RepID=A0A8X7C4K6_9ARAC|nr:estradiol 17-beta-dehydrogenase 2 [Trichonephila inaurata madagascariensis]
MTFRFTKKHYLSDRIQPDNKAVFITGCDSGFGNALAKQLDSSGFHVFASCLDANGPGADDLRKSCSKRFQILEMNVTKDESVKQAVQFVKTNLGTSELWAIVNNAGVQKGFTAELTSMKDFYDTLEVNAFGPVRVTKAFLPLLRQSRGRVVNLTSLAGRLALPHCTPYTMSKFACVGFTECLRHELDVWGIRVISIEPEFFQTNMTNIENIEKRVDEAFSSIEDDVRTDYGEQYIKNFKLHASGTTTSPKIHKVLDAIEMAISLEHPDYVYRPCRNLFARIVLKLFEISPKVLRVLLINFHFYLTGFPKPKEADNNL